MSSRWKDSIFTEPWLNVAPDMVVIKELGKTEVSQHNSRRGAGDGVEKELLGMVPEARVGFVGGTGTA